MNENVRSAIVKECELWGYGTDANGMYGMLCDTDSVYEERVISRRHWDDYLYVVPVGDMFIGYIGEYSTGDMSGDLGFEFDPNTVCEMRPVEVTTVVYKPKEIDQ